MKQVQVLLPYALASAAVLVASAIALAGSLGTAPVGPGLAVAPSRPPSAVGRVAALSDQRMAYWRAASGGSLELWVGDLAGGRRWPVATASGDADIALTRWSPDGSAVAYRTATATIGIVHLDGSFAALIMPAELRFAGWKIDSFEWSPDARSIAATFRAGRGLSNESDVYVTDARGSARSGKTAERPGFPTTEAWQRVTTLGDAHAGRWIDNDRLFIETSGGMIAVLDLETRSLRPMTGIVATSPLVGRDGRVYFIGGGNVAALPDGQPVATGSVWSATIDGDELRRETSVVQAQGRLLGLLADGRAVTGVPGGIHFVAASVVPLARVGPGTVRRVVIADEGRGVIGITESQIMRIDPAKIPRTLEPGSASSGTPATVLLSAARDADVWIAPKAVTLARSAAPVAERPQARLAFVLGRTLWQVDPLGAPRALLSEPTFFLSSPRWSPSGEHLAAILTSGSPARVSVVVTGPSATKRWELPALPSDLHWSPDSARLALWSPSGQRADEWTTQLYDADTGTPGERIAGRAAWTAEGRIVLTDGQLDPVAAVAAGQRVEVIEGGSRRTMTDAAGLAAAPIVRTLPNATLPAVISRVMPLGEPGHIAVQLSRARQGGIASSAWLVVRVSDGEPVWAFASDARGGPSDVTPSPVGPLMGWTVEPTASSRHAVVVDPIANTTTVLGLGRFGGWAPDGRWAYVARDEGLFAYPLEGGEPVRINAFGVPVAVAKP